MPVAISSNDLTMTIEEAVEKATIWMKMDGVEGVAQSTRDGMDCIMVFSSVNLETLQDTLPAIFEGYPVIIQYSGEIEVHKD